MYHTPSPLKSNHFIGSSCLQVVLEVQNAKQLLALASRLEEDGILFKAWIEQPENIPTAIACSPNRKSVLSPYFKSLKLCKG
jgi:peptidyl-tRNA hydrolase